MAGARYEKIGSIFARTSGLLKSGVLKESDRPMWFDIYKAFPPKLEPRIDRPVPKDEIKPILYPEDKIRAKFYTTFGSPGAIDLSYEGSKSICQRFVERYLVFEAAGQFGNDEDAIFKATVQYFVDVGLNLDRQRTSVRTRIKNEVIVKLFDKDTVKTE